MASVVVDLSAYRERLVSEASATRPVQEHSMLKSVQQEMRAQLATLRNVSDNWDGLGSLPPTQEALAGASYFIDLWEGSVQVTTEVGLLSDGSISFEFYDAEDDLLGALDLLGEDEATFALTIDGAGEEFGEISLSESSHMGIFFNALKKAKASRE
ncbi:MAG: hypothetical protein AB3N24_18100 [Leisingera sp.]